MNGSKTGKASGATYVAIKLGNLDGKHDLRKTLYRGRNVGAAIDVADASPDYVVVYERMVVDGEEVTTRSVHSNAAQTEWHSRMQKSIDAWLSKRLYG